MASILLIFLCANKSRELKINNKIQFKFNILYVIYGNWKMLYKFSNPLLHDFNKALKLNIEQCAIIELQL